MNDVAHSGFIAPPKARYHCRYYSYDLSGAGKSGPRCAVDALASTPGAAACCMPEPKETCSSRVEWTIAERSAWDEWYKLSVVRLVDAVAALPAPIPLKTSGTVICPNCGGRLGYSRWHGGAAIGCETEGCCSARFNIAHGVDWPARVGERRE